MNITRDQFKIAIPNAQREVEIDGEYSCIALRRAIEAKTDWNTAVDIANIYGDYLLDRGFVIFYKKDYTDIILKKKYSNSLARIKFLDNFKHYFLSTHEFDEDQTETTP